MNCKMKTQYDWPGRKLLLARCWKSSCLIGARSINFTRDASSTQIDYLHDDDRAIIYVYDGYCENWPDLHCLMTGELT